MTVMIRRAFPFARCNHSSSAPRVFRRFAGTGHSESAHHANPVNESFGKGFFVAIAVIPASFAAIKFLSSSMEDGVSPLLTRVIDSYSVYKERWAERNTLHTRMIEQAAFDRNLFQSAERSPTFELRFPETFNVGSPYNVVAGHGGANLDKLMEHYQRENRECEERKLRKLEQRTRLQKEEREGRNVKG
ncbi:MAG: hypothetical protein M1833_004820 [Piccolia ochrophora]|nr:MAG: hypothetical protein M1833_004820 [Piccolia ochrophora]